MPKPVGLFHRHPRNAPGDPGSYSARGDILKAFFDATALWDYNSNVGTLADAICGNLRNRRLSSGAWSFSPKGNQAALEPTCLALLALCPDLQDRAVEPLLRLQSKNGSSGAFERDEEGSGLTGIALLTLNKLGVRGGAPERSLSWLLNSCGREAHWLQNWKFRMTDTRVQFNPAKFGWPWQPGTCSWVVPTAFALIALQQTFPGRRCGKVGHRIHSGVEMLFDRACPGGGWNAGNGVVYGHPMKPHIDATAMALLALRAEPFNSIVESSLSWLEGQASLCPAPWSLAWAILALHAYNRSIGPLQQRLLAILKPETVADNATLAAAVLALKCETDNNPFRAIV
ncbi:MAG: prenyltransferase/squalene oxidase repeat-containing protein [Terriglobia bacterium]